MAADKNDRGFIPPYVSWKTFFNLILRMEKEGVPARIDSTYLQKTAPVIQGYLKATMRQFGLIDDNGHPTPDLIELVENRDKRPHLIGEIVRAHYGPQLALPQNATAQQLHETFKTQQGETKRKAVTFFLQAARYAEIPLSPQFRPPTRPPATRKPKQKESPSEGRQEHEEVDPQPQIGDSSSVTLGSGAVLTLGLSTKLLKLPRDERKFFLDLVEQMEDHGGSVAESQSDDEELDEEEEEE